jgi:hypothetical protein
MSDQEQPQGMSDREQPHGPDGELLSKRRPAPSRQFGDDLRRRLLELDAHERRPRYLWLLVAVYVVAGAALLLIAAVGVGV